MTVHPWDLLGEPEPFLAKLYVFSPLLVGLASLAVALGTRRPFPFGLGLLLCGAGPFVLRLISPPHGYFGSFLALFDSRMFLFLLLLSGMLVGSFLRIFYGEERLPRLLSGLTACAILFFLMMPDVLGVGTSYMAFVVTRFEYSIGEGVALLVPLMAPILAACSLTPNPVWGRRLGWAVVLLFFLPLGILYVRLFIEVTQRDILFFGFVFLRLTGSILLDFLLVSIGLSFVVGSLIAGRRRREDLESC